MDLDSDGKLRRNFEHASSEANAEFQSSSNLHVYSFKSEGEWRDLIYHGALNNPGVALWVRNCSQVLPLLASGFGNNFFFMSAAYSVQVNVYSFGGNARAMATGRTYPEGNPKPKLNQN